MADDLDRKTNAILQIIAESKEPIGALDISQKLKSLGINMPERTVRYHLKLMNEKGLLKVIWKEGRLITSKGKEELSDAMVFDKVGLMSSRIENMAYKMDFDLYKKTGSVLLNISFIHKSDFSTAIKLMAPVFNSKLATGNMVLAVEQGRTIGSITVPVGKVAFGTLCSINLNSILLRHFIPVESKFGGILQIEKNEPFRFTEIITYSGSTLDPHEIFIKSKMTSVIEAAKGSGKILAGLREIPAASRNEAEAVLRKVEAAGIGRALLIGNPGQTILGIPVNMERVGLVVPGGLNPIAACEEWGLETESHALSVLVDYSELVEFSNL
jgi:repressor of nif and glnA expression